MSDAIAKLAELANPAQRKMVGHQFYIDGWHNRGFLSDAIWLRDMGLVTESAGSSDEQYTQYVFIPTDLGASVMRHLESEYA